MSSILKALKKLENETSEKSDATPSLLQFYTKKPTKKGIKSGRMPNRRRFVIFGTIILLAGSGTILTFKPWQRQPPPPTTTDQNAELMPVTPAQTKTTAPTRKSDTPTVKIESGAPHQLNNVAEKPGVPTQKSTTDDQKLLPKTAADSTEKAGVVEKKPALSQPVKKSPLVSGNKKLSEQKTGDDRWSSVPVKQSNESMLELQAIAWSQHPEKRMAVINNNIVHEGESVERVTVKHIGKNDVVFLKEGQMWRQLFRH